MMIDTDLTTSKKLEMSLDDIGKAMGKGVRKSEDFKGTRGPRYRRDGGGYRYNSRPRFNNYNRNRFRNSNFKRQESKFIVRAENLDHTVMQKDLMELFSTVGDVLKVWVDYDHTDRSKGTGGCIFRFSDDAKKAITKYNGSVLQGRTLQLHGEIVIRNRQPFRQRNNFNQPQGRFRGNRFNNARSPW